MPSSIGDSTDWSALLEQTIGAVREAGDIIRNHWVKPRNIKYKGRIDLVTETDVAVEKHMRATLGEILPQAAFVGEETAAIESGFPETCWVVDPVDGTTNFAHKLPFVATSIGLYHKGEMRLGVVYNPIMDELFYAERGKGAFCNGELMHVSEADDLKHCVTASGFPYDIENNVEPVLTAMREALTHSQAVRRFGAAALDLAYTAWGRFDVFFEGFLHPWDTSAGWLLVEEAGGRVTSLSPSRPYSLECNNILATNGKVHEEIGALLGKTGLEEASRKAAASR